MNQLFTSGSQSIGASASANPSSEKSRLISFRINWFGLLAVQGTLKSLLQHHSLKASVLWCSAFFMDQLWHTCMTTGKTIALTICTFVGKVMSLLFKTLGWSKLFFQGASVFLILWLQAPSAVILEPKKMKSLTVPIVSPSICHEVKGLDAIFLVFWMLTFKPAFSLSVSLSSRGSLVPLCFLP